MIAVPAIDLREGACVQLVGGDYAHERVRLPDPLAALARWREAGFTRCHLVDLDAATGRGSNAAAIAQLLAAGAGAIRFSVGGGVRSDARVGELLDAGADTVVVGTRALEEPAWLERLAARFPGRLVLAADVRGRAVVARGWSEATSTDVLEVVRRIAALPVAGLLVTAVHREGLLGGTDVPLMAEIALASRHPLVASGGVGSLDDLRALAGAGAAQAVIGMALYSGALDPVRVAKEFA